MKRDSAKGGSPPSPIFRSKRRPIRSEEKKPAERLTRFSDTPSSPIFRSKRKSGSVSSLTASDSPPSPIFQSKRKSSEEKSSAENETADSSSPPSPIFQRKRKRSEEKNSAKKVTAVRVSPPSPIFRSERRSQWCEEKKMTVSRVTAVSEVSLCNTSGASGLEDSEGSFDFSEDELLALKSKVEGEEVVKSTDQTCSSGGEGGGVKSRSIRLSELVAPPLLSLGCPLLDASLMGGLRPGEITEVVGESSAGKTQFSLQVALQAAVRGETVIFIVTEGSFPSARLDQMVRAREVERARDNILVLQARNLPHLMVVLGEEVGKAVTEHPGVSLVVLDSVASLVRSDENLRTGLERGLAVHRLGQSLLKLSSRGLAVVAVNQVTASLRRVAGRDVMGRGLVASLGQVWDQYPHTRLWLSKTRYVVSRTASRELQGLVAETRLRTVHVDWSCRLPNTVTHFVVDTKGCHGVEIKDY